MNTDQPTPRDAKSVVGKEFLTMGSGADDPIQIIEPEKDDGILRCIHGRTASECCNDCYEGRPAHEPAKDEWMFEAAQYFRDGIWIACVVRSDNKHLVCRIERGSKQEAEAIAKQIVEDHGYKVKYDVLNQNLTGDFKAQDKELQRLRMACQKEFASVQKLDEENRKLRAELDQAKEEIADRAKVEQETLQNLLQSEKERDKLHAELEVIKKSNDDSRNTQQS